MLHGLHEDTDPLSFDRNGIDPIDFIAQRPFQTSV